MLQRQCDVPRSNPHFQHILAADLLWLLRRRYLDGLLSFLFADTEFHGALDIITAFRDSVANVLLWMPLLIKYRLASLREFSCQALNCVALPGAGALPCLIVNRLSVF